MDKLEQTINKVEKQIKGHPSVVVAFSGSPTSILLLHIVHKIKEVPLLLFKDFWSKEHQGWVENFVAENELTAFSYLPAEILTDDTGTSLLTTYSFNGASIPIKQKINNTDKCGLNEVKRQKFNPLIPYLWELTITGARKEADSLVSGILSHQSNTVLTPLWDWTLDEVNQAIKLLGLEIPPTNSEFNNCLRCVNKQKTKVFCPKEGKEIKTI